MILELTRLCALDRPMPGIVDPWRHLIGEKEAVDRKQLESQYSDIIQPIHQASAVIDRERARLRGRVRCRNGGFSEDAISVNILDGRIKNLSPPHVARADH